MEIWKVGSNWQATTGEKRVFYYGYFFLKYEIVFAYKNIRNFSTVVFKKEI